MSTDTDTPAGAVEPGRAYTVPELAVVVGHSPGHIRGLCRAKLVEHRRSGPGPRARVTITGAQWLDYQKWLTRPATGRKAAGVGATPPAPSHRPPAVVAPRPPRSAWSEASKRRA